MISMNCEEASFFRLSKKPTMKTSQYRGESTPVEERESHARVQPSPDGRRWREAPDEGLGAGDDRVMPRPSPGPSLRSGPPSPGGRGMNAALPPLPLVTIRCPADMPALQRVIVRRFSSPPNSR